MEIDPLQFAEILQKASRAQLPRVTLKALPTISPETVKPTENEALNPPPEEMAYYELVPNEQYYFSYDIRFLQLQFLVEQGSRFEAGTIEVYHAFSPSSGPGSSETTAPTEPGPFLPPDLEVNSSTTSRSAQLPSVALHFEDVPGINPRFGLSFRITSSVPSDHPSLVCSIKTAFSRED